MKVLLVQRINTTNDINGNPRRLVTATEMDLDSNSRIVESKGFEMGYRDAMGILEDNLNINTFDHIQYLNEINVSVSEYKRLKRFYGIN